MKNCLERLSSVFTSDELHIADYTQLAVDSTTADNYNRVQSMLPVEASRETLQRSPFWLGVSGDRVLRHVSYVSPLLGANAILHRDRAFLLQAAHVAKASVDGCSSRAFCIHQIWNLVKSIFIQKGVLRNTGYVRKRPHSWRRLRTPAASGWSGSHPPYSRKSVTTNPRSTPVEAWQRCMKMQADPIRVACIPSEYPPHFETRFGRFFLRSFSPSSALAMSAAVGADMMAVVCNPYFYS